MWYNFAMRHPPQFRSLGALAAALLACRLLRWMLHPAGSFRAVALGARLCRLRAIPVVRPASFCALASLALAAVLFSVPAEQARAHTSTAGYHGEFYPLHAAVRDGVLASVSHFIDEHEENIVNQADYFGETPLHLASNGATGHVTIAATLIAAGANVNVTNINGNTPLHFAAEDGHASIVSLLIAATASLNLKNKVEGRTPLYMAARNGHVFVVSMLIAAKASLDVQGAYGQTPLHQAANYGRVTIADMLIAAGASLNVRSSGGDTPLYWAVFSNEVSIASALIAAGADVHAGQIAGFLWTPLLLAASKGRASIADMLIAAGATLDVRDRDNNTPLHLAADGGHSAFVSLLLAKTASVGVKNDDGDTPLHLAAANGRAAAVAALLAGGADVNLKNDDGETPLHLAADGGHAVVVTALIAAAGADVNLKNNNDETPLHYAAAGDHAAVVAALLAAGGHWGEACGDPAVVNLAGPSPPCVSVEVCEGLNQFYDAALSTCVPVAVCDSSLSEVLYAGVNDCHVRFGLHAAAEAGDLDIVNHFITVHKADVNLKVVPDGNAPLHLAAYYGHVSVAATLLAAGANVNLKNNDGKTPLHRAASAGHPSVVALLISAGGHWGEVCADPAVVNLAGPSPPCVSVEACKGLNQFYDAALSTCVPVAVCDSSLSEVLYAGVNDCHVPFGLHAAAEAGDLDIVNHFITVHKADVNLKVGRYNGNAPLHLAAHYGHVSVAAALLAAGANVNGRKPSNGFTPLHVAAYSGHVSVAAALLAAGANVSLKTNGGATPLHRAVEAGHPSVVALLISADADVNAAFGSNASRTPLVISSESHSESNAEVFALIVDLLIAAGGHWGTVCQNEKVVNPAGSRPACVCPSPTVETDLGVCESVAVCASPSELNEGTNRCDCDSPNVGENGAEAPGDCVTPAAAECLAEDPRQFYSETDSECVDFVVCDAPSERNDRTNLCDCSAPYYGMSGVEAPGGDCALASKEVCEGLGQFYDAALSACVPFVTCASSLVRYAETNDCHAPGGLFAAVKAGDLDLVNHFVTVHMADVNSKDRHQWALLHHAAGRGHIPVVTALISLGANVNVQNDSGQTPLHRAVNNDLVSVAATLIALGANVNARSFRAQGGQTPLTYTRGRSGPDVDALIALLIANGGHWGTVCKNGNVANPTGDSPDCVSCPSDRITAERMCVIPPAVIAAANATLLAEVRKREPNLAVVRRALDLKANPNITTSAGITVLVVAATLLHADVVSVLITAGANPLVKVDGVSDATYNPNASLRFIPEALMERGLLAPPTDGGRRLAETFIHFGDAAGGGFDWQAASLGGETTGDLAFTLADALRQTINLNAGAGSGEQPLEAVLRYLLDRGAGCGADQFADTTNWPDSPTCVPFAACDAPSVLNAGTNLCDCPAPGVGRAKEAPGMCACPDEWNLDNGTCVPAPAVAAAANATLLAEVSKTSPESPDLAVMREALGLGASPNITTSAGIPVLVVAATLLHADVVSVLITAGADPTVKAAGIYHATYNPSTVSRFIPEALMDAGRAVILDAFSQNALVSQGGDVSAPAIERRLAETFIHFGDAAGDRFNWQAAALRGTTGESAFSLAESLRRIFLSLDDEALSLDAVLGYLLDSDRGVDCPSVNLYDIGQSIDSSLCARPACSATSGQTYSCSAACAGFSLRALDGGSCVSQCGDNQVADTTTWPDSQCRCAHGEEVGESGCLSEFDAALVSAALEPKPDLAAIRALLNQGANPNVTSNGVPLLAVAATLLRADVVGVLITAGADPMVKVPGKDDEVFNPRSVSIFIPEAIIQAGRDDPPRAAGTRLAETFIRFGEAAGDRFDWDTESLTRFYLNSNKEEDMTVGDWSFILADDLHDLLRDLKDDEGSESLEAVLRYLLDRGVARPAKRYNEEADTPPSQGARPTCPVTSGKTYSCTTCAGFPLRDPLRDVDGDGGSCVSHCGPDKVADTTAWPDSQCRCAHEGDADASGCPSELDAALIREVRASPPNLATIRALLNRRANPDIAVDGTPLLFVAATLLRAEVVGVLVTAGADPLVKVAGIAHSVYNSSGASRSIPEGLLELGFHGRAPVSLRMAETFVRFGDAAGDLFWATDGAQYSRLFGLLDGLRRRAAAEPDFEASHLRTMARYLLSRGASCPAANQYTSDSIPSDALCACPSGTGFLDGACVACPAGRILENGECKVDATAANAMLAAEIRELSPSLSTVRAALDAGANPNLIVNGRPALIVAGRRGHAKVVSVLVTAGANVNARDPRDNSYSNSRNFALHAVGRLSVPGFPISRATRASLLYHFGDALDVRNAIFGDAKFNWNFTLADHAMLDGIADAVVFDTGFGGQDDLNILKEMADYAILRGAMCVHSSSTSGSQAARDICNGSAEVQRLLAQAALVAEVEKAPGAANVATVRALLSGANAVDPNVANSAGWPALILAARNGHAQIVSVLVTARADVNATDPTFLSADAVQHAADRLGDQPTVSSPQWVSNVLSRQSDVFYAFGGGLDVRNAASGDAAFDWNREDGGGYRLLDLLAFAEDKNPNLRASSSSSNLDIVHNMADYAIIRGAECGAVTTDRTTRRICTGSPRIAGARASLVAEVKKLAGAAKVSVVLDLLNEEGVHPNIEDSDGRPLLILAARNGHAEIVSVLVTIGADVNAADSFFRNFGAVHHAASPLGGAAGPPALRSLVLSYFGGGLDVRNAAAPDAAAFDWNREGANGFRPLDLLVDSLSRTADAADRIVLQDMADYLIARGAECGVQAADQNHPACRGTLKTLLDEVEKPAGAANVSVFSELLDVDAATLDHVDSHGRSLLILAARNGHPRLVSVLAAAGADVNAADAGFDSFGVAHHAAAPLSGANAGDAAGPRALRASVLSYFGGGLDARKAASDAAAFDWNRKDANGRRPLDLLVLAADESPQPEAEDAAVIRQMSDYMIARGASCGDATADQEHIICVGPARKALLDAVKKPRDQADAAEVLRLLGVDNVTPDAEDLDGTPILIVAATMGHAEIVSVLVTAGAKPDARLSSSICDGASIGRAVPHLTAQNNFNPLAPAQSTLYYTWGTALNVLRHFADAVNQVDAPYDWNAHGVPADCSSSGDRRAIDYLRPRHSASKASLPGEGIRYKLEAMGRMADILIANGASCSSSEKIVKDHVTCFGAARISLISTNKGDVAAQLLREEDSVHPNIKDMDGRPVLINMARYGHPEVVSVLITAGADPNARWNGDFVPHLVMRNNFNQPSDTLSLYYGWGKAQAVLQHFIDAVNETRSADYGWEEYDWEATNDDNQRAVELADYRYNHTLALFPKTGGGRTESEASKKNRILKMVDMLLAQGDSCRPEHTMGWHDSVTCVGFARQALLEEVKKPRARAAEVLRLLDDRSVSPDTEDLDGTPILIVAATMGHAEIVGALITAGANPNARLSSSICDGASIGRAVPHLTAQNNFNPLTPAESTLYYTWGTALKVLRHFAEAVNDTPSASYDWNAPGADLDCADESNARAPDFLRPRYAAVAASAPGESDAAKRLAMERMAAVLAANGSSCENQNNKNHVTCAALPSAVTVEYSENPSDKSGGTLTASILSGGTALYGARITFTARPANGWGLLAWQGDAAATCPQSDGECALPANGNLRVTAQFSPALNVRYAADPASEVFGRVIISGTDGVADGVDFVLPGGTVTFTAKPAKGWQLAAWTGDVPSSCSPSELKCAVAPIGDLRVTALFKQAPRARYAAEFDPPGKIGGSVAVFGTNGVVDGEAFAFVYSGRTVTFTATPANGWEILDWAGDASTCPSSDRECAVVAADRDLWVTVRFKQAPRARHAAESDPPGQIGGSVTVFGTDGVEDGEAFVYSGRTVTFTAEPANGWQLSAWEGNELNCPPSDRECAVVAADRDLWVTARFSPAPRVRHASEPSSGGSVTIAGTDGEENGEAFVYSGRTVTFTAEPTNGWEVSVWAGDAAASACPPSDWKCEVVAANDDLWVTVLFSEAPRARFSFDPSDKSRGWVTVTGTDGVEDGVDFVYSGGTVTFTAEPAHGYRLSAWLGDCAGESQLSCKVAATLDVSVGATFDDINECQDPDNMHDCAAAEDGGFCANTDGGFTCSCVAGYSGSGKVCYADKTVSFRQPANGTLSAAGAGVTIDTGETTRHGTTVTFTVDPAFGYRLSAWLGDCAGEFDLSCEVVAMLDVSVGVTLTDIGECVTSAQCATDGGRCNDAGGVFECVCDPGYSGDGKKACHADKTVSFQSSANGTLSAVDAKGRGVEDGGTTRHGTTITFTAAPNAGYQVSAWLGACAGTAATVAFCEVGATLDVSVSVTFSDINECRDDTHNCAAEGGFCTNTAGGFACSCVAGYSGDGMTCRADKIVSFPPSPNGTLSAESEGVTLRNGGAVTSGATITFTAAPDAGYQVSMWTGDCAGTSVDASAGSAFCEVVATAAVSAGATFDYIGRCAVSGHLIFGAPSDRRCAPPTVCPTDYIADNDCLSAAPGLNPPRLPDAANEPNACARVFGGRMRTAGGGQTVCSQVDRNDTFCLVGSQFAFPCRGLFKHVWTCNTDNRPALNPFFCGERCEGGANMARGSECGQETL